MAQSEPLLTPDLARAARALAQVSVDHLAEAATLDPAELRAFERSRATVEPDENRRLRRALEDVGVLFVPEDDEAGVGVRRKYNRRKVRRLESWENEGGPAYEDDI